MENTTYLENYVTGEGNWTDAVGLLPINTTANASINAQESKSPIDTLANYELYQIAVKMVPYYTWIFCISGMCGNFLALLIILQKKMRGVSSAVFVASIAISDNITLFGFFFGMVSIEYFKQAINNPLCKMYFFIISVGSMISAWSVVAMTFERALIVSFPLQAPNWTSRTRAGVIAAIIVVYSVLHSLHFIWTGITVFFDGPQCYHDYANHQDFLSRYTLFDSFMAFYIPLVLIFFLNSVIIIQMKRARRFQKTMTNTSKSKQEGSESKNQSDSATNQITIMLLSVSICFFVLMAPYGMFQIYFQHIVDLSQEPFSKQAEVYFIAQIMSMLWQINHSINVVLYCLTGRKFRNTLLGLCPCGEKMEQRGSTAFTSGTFNTTNGAVTSMTSVNTVSTTGM